MKRILTVFSIALIASVLYSQSGLQLSSQGQKKVLSGKLYESVKNSGKSTDGKLKSTSPDICSVILYFEDYPSKQQALELENLSVKLYFETWTPPVYDHKYGFLIARVPLGNLPKVIELSSVKMIDSGERSSKAMNNDASLSTHAQMSWQKGFTGKGVKICILDSGIDTTYAGSDLPASFIYKDYSYFPQLDNDVTNKITGHGTHVAATALGRGKLSEGQEQINNGSGSFKGMAPDADLIFLKIGQDEDAVSEDPPTIAAIDAAVNIYHAGIISMSYGGWEDYHDGTSALEQKVDWAYSLGVPFFCSAGNDAERNKHWMGTVNAHSQSDFIKVNVSDPGGDTTMLRFNMVCADGTDRSNLQLNYYNESKQQLTDIVSFPSTESPKGTESKYSYYKNALYSAGIYYLKVVNNSDKDQMVHLYEDWSNLRIGTDHVSFDQGFSSYTIGAPASAAHAFAVGAYVSRTIWTSSLASDRWYGETSKINYIAPFSSLGPTMDQRIKPDICGPGSVIISLRDKDIYYTENNVWVDNDGVAGGNANYYVMRGTSMSCPVVSGSAALFLEKYPDASAQEVYDAIVNFSNTSGLNNLPDNTWGNGKMDIYSAIRKSKDVITVDGDIENPQYKTISAFTSGQNGFGSDNEISELRYYTDGENLYVGITGKVSVDNSILLFMDFSGVQGKGSNTLGGGDPEHFVDCPFSYLNNVRMDFDVDFALGLRAGDDNMSEFYIDAARYGDTNKVSILGKTNKTGANGCFNVGKVFGGEGFMLAAYDNSYSIGSSKGVELKIPISAFAEVDTSQTIRMFAVISSFTGNISNECIPGNPGINNPGDGADFSVIPGDFFTQPFKISSDEHQTEFTEKSARSLFIYPNPATDWFTVQSNGLSESISIKIFDTYGRLVMANKTANNAPIDVSGLSEGLYFISVETEKSGTAVKKLLIVK